MTLSEEQYNALYINFMREFEGPCWMAGGSITNVYMNYRPRDTDLYFPCIAARDRAGEVALKIGYEIHAAGPLFIKFRDVKNMGSYMKPLNELDTPDFKCSKNRPDYFDAIVLGETPQETISMFDFTINQIAIDKPTKLEPLGKLYTAPTTEQDIINRQIHIAGTHPNKFLPNKAKQLIKNIKKGFTIERKEIIKWFPGIPKYLNKPEQQILWLINFIISFRHKKSK